MVWHGWGDPAARSPLPAHALRHLDREIGLGRPSRPVALPDVRLRPPALPDPARRALTDAVGAAYVLDDRETRVRHAGGKSYPDLVRRRTGDAMDAPDAVVLPGDHDEVAAVLAVCAEHEVAVVPFGGGTSVVGGVEPVRGRFPAVISVDLGRLDRMVTLDPISRTATVQAGMRGPAVEAALAPHRLTLGHFPQSYEYSTVGGWIAARSAGQASTGYGRADRSLQGLRAATPVGDLDLGRAPASAAGPDLRQLLAGSEGTLGVITEATFAVRPAPATSRFEGWFLPSFTVGATALRELVQTGAAPDLARLSDEEETRASLALAGPGGLAGRIGRAYLRVRRRLDGCLVVLGFDGAPRVVARRRSAAAQVLRSHGGVYAGTGPGQAWAASRFRTPYLRDDLLDHGVLVDTLETATSWTALPDLHRAVGDALRESLGSRSLVQCHVSHLYDTGASLYFTFLAREDPDPLAQWRAAKQASLDAIVAAGGTVSHHHGIGRDHSGWLTAEIGEPGVAALRAVKAALDPLGILNPGALLP